MTRNRQLCIIITRIDRGHFLCAVPITVIFHCTNDVLAALSRLDVQALCLTSIGQLVCFHLEIISVRALIAHDRCLAFVDCFRIRMISIQRLALQVLGAHKVQFEAVDARLQNISVLIIADLFEILCSIFSGRIKLCRSVFCENGSIKAGRMNVILTVIGHDKAFIQFVFHIACFDCKFRHIGAQNSLAVKRRMELAKVDIFPLNRKSPAGIRDQPLIACYFVFDPRFDLVHTSICRQFAVLQLLIKNASILVRVQIHRLFILIGGRVDWPNRRRNRCSVVYLPDGL